MAADRRESDLPSDITRHVLHHRFASYNEPTIAGLLGHKAHSITSRDLHSAYAVLLAAADDDPGRSGSGGTG